MALLETATGPLAYDERGEGDPIVLLSSGAHDRHDFDDLRELLPARFRSIAPDWPAHGESPPGSAPATAMRFADVAEELVDGAGPRAAPSSSATRSAASPPGAWRSAVPISSRAWSSSTAAASAAGRPRSAPSAR